MENRTSFGRSSWVTGSRALALAVLGALALGAGCTDEQDQRSSGGTSAVQCDAAGVCVEVDVAPVCTAGILCVDGAGATTTTTTGGSTTGRYPITAGSGGGSTSGEVPITTGTSTSSGCGEGAGGCGETPPNGSSSASGCGEGAGGCGSENGAGGSSCGGGCGETSSATTGGGGGGPCDCGGKLITRTQGFWKNHTCVLEGEATGYPLLPITIGSSFTLELALEVEVYLDWPVDGDHQYILGQQIVAAKLNVAAFGIGDIPFANIDGAPGLETVSEIIAAADSIYESGLPRAMVDIAGVLDALNNTGTEEESWFDPNCVDAPSCD